jgi:hypothetical protein
MLSAKKNPRNIFIKLANKLYRDLYENPKRSEIASLINKTAPSPKSPSDLNYTAHTLLSRKNLLMGIWSAKSLNLACHLSLPWTFHDDGSLKEEDVYTLQYHFPGCRVLKKSFADHEINKLREKYPKTLSIRDQYVLMLKVVDLAVFAEREKILFVDSDVLFFKKPAQLISLLNTDQSSNFFNKDVKSCYLYENNELKHMTGIQIPEKINSGLSVLHKKIIDLEITEKLLKQFPLTPELIYHRIEQTLIMLLSALSSYGTSHLDDTYDVILDKDIKHTVCKHYVGAIRRNFELEGLQYLIYKLNFMERWQIFAAQPKE